MGRVLLECNANPLLLLRLHGLCGAGCLYQAILDGAVATYRLARNRHGGCGLRCYGWRISIQTKLRAGRKEPGADMELYHPECCGHDSGTISALPKHSCESQQQYCMAVDRRYVAHELRHVSGAHHRTQRGSLSRGAHYWECFFAHTDDRVDYLCNHLSCGQADIAVAGE